MSDKLDNEEIKENIESDEEIVKPKKQPKIVEVPPDDSSSDEEIIIKK